MERRFSYRAYERRFAKPLRTAHGVWELRAGFLLRAEIDGRLGYGEVAPLRDFGTESDAEADAFLRALSADPALADDADRLRTLPCCAFALSTALECAAEGGSASGSLSHPVAALLPAGEEAIGTLKARRRDGYRCFKWKMGVEPHLEEERVMGELLAALPEGARLRLDGNEGLTLAGLRGWLRFLKPHAEQIEFFEQPLPVGEEAAMADAAASFGIPIALDESLDHAQAARWLEPSAWEGPLVIKPSLMGDWREQLTLFEPVAGRLVFSSSFETGVGIAACLRLADRLPEMERPLGFDTARSFDDALAPSAVASSLSRSSFGEEVLNAIWDRLSPLS